VAERKNVSTGTPWEAVHGYSRAVRVGSLVFVSGTTASDAEGNVIGVGNVYTQTAYALQKIARALGEVNASLNDVVRTRCFVTDISQWKEVSKAHAEVFGDIRPVSTMVEVKALIDPAHLVEIEVDAVVSE
jgi:enamine deaminase RidA (YjgF/YER057c/UK114 family)